MQAICISFHYSVLQAGCSSLCPVSIVKALKAVSRLINRYILLTHSLAAYTLGCSLRSQHKHAFKAYRFHCYIGSHRFSYVHVRWRRGVVVSGVRQ